MWEHVDFQFSDILTSQTKSSFPKRKSTRTIKPLPSPGLRPIMVPNPILPHLDHISLFMKRCIVKIVDVKGDGNCRFLVVVKHIGISEESHSMILMSHLLSILIYFLV